MTVESLKKKIEKKEAIVCVAGLGYVGLCLSAFIANKGFAVVGADVDRSKVKTISKGKAPFYEPELDDLLKKVVEKGRLKATTEVAEVVKISDIIFVTVGTPIREGEIDLSYLEKAVESIGKNLSKGKLVIIKSTVTPGTTEGIVKQILEEESGLKGGIDFWLTYCPERLAEGKALKELRTLPIIIGGIDEASGKLAKFFIEALGLKAILVSNARTAEMVKLADNLWIDQSIALANQLALLCEKLEIDVHEVIKAANTLPRGIHFVNIMFPGLVGGSCLSKDPYFVARLAEERGIDASLILAARKLNERMYLHIVDLVKSALREIGKSMEESKIAVLGLAYKGETSDIRESQAIPLVRELRKMGAEVAVHDPYVTSPPEDIEIKSLEEAAKDTDCIIVATEHSKFREISLEYLAKLVRKPCTLVDARAIFDPVKAKKLGFIWRGLGRP